MAFAPDNYLHTTHRTVNWFRKTFEAEELVLTPPYQRQAVWTPLQQSYLLDTILNGLPIPELYMQDVGDADGNEKHIVVDGQQRIRAVLEYVEGQYSLEGPDVSAPWRNREFKDLHDDQKKCILGYKFVVRILPAELRDEDIRAVFSRINKNVVNLNDQELRNATYSGEFIEAIQKIADDDPFWADSGIFSANDHRRMLDHEFISELVVACLHGLQNKKDRLDDYYQRYETNFENRAEVAELFKVTTLEIARILPNLRSTRWRKRSDFYTMFTEFASRNQRMPFDEGNLDVIRGRIVRFGNEVDEILKLDDRDRGGFDRNVITYARGVSRAASDRGNRIARSYAFSRKVFEEEPLHELPEPRQEEVAAGLDEE